MDHWKKYYVYFFRPLSAKFSSLKVPYQHRTLLCSVTGKIILGQKKKILQYVWESLYILNQNFSLGIYLKGTPSRDGFCF